MAIYPFTPILPSKTIFKVSAGTYLMNDFKPIWDKDPYLINYASRNAKLGPYTLPSERTENDVPTLVQWKK